MAETVVGDDWYDSVVEGDWSDAERRARGFPPLRKRRQLTAEEKRVKNAKTRVTYWIGELAVAVWRLRGVTPPDELEEFDRRYFEVTKDWRDASARQGQWSGWEDTDVEFDDFGEVRMDIQAIHRSIPQQRERNFAQRRVDECEEKLRHYRAIVGGHIPNTFDGIL
jgi:hypothetical protein